MKRLLHLRIICWDRHEVPVEIEENASVKDLRKLFCSLKGVPSTEVRLLLRNMELHDDGTLQYYRVFDGTKLHAVKRLRVDHRPTSPPHKGQKPDASRSTGAGRDAAEGSNRNASAPGDTAERKGDSKSSLRENYARAPPPPSSPDRLRQTAPVVGYSLPPRPDSDTTAALRETKRPSRDDVYYAGGGDTDLAGTSELDRLVSNVASLKRELRESLPEVPTLDAAETLNATSTDAWQRRVASLEERLHRADERYDASCERITELENTIRRYQQLMRKVSAALASHGM